jgi:hypothetical protein
VALACLLTHAVTTREQWRCYRAVCDQPGAARGYHFAMLRLEACLLFMQAVFVAMSCWRVYHAWGAGREITPSFELLHFFRVVGSIAAAIAVASNLRDFRRIRREAL